MVSIPQFAIKDYRLLQPLPPASHSNTYLPRNRAGLDAPQSQSTGPTEPELKTELEPNILLAHRTRFDIGIILGSYPFKGTVSFTTSAR